MNDQTQFQGIMYILQIAIPIIIGFFIKNWLSSGRKSLESLKTECHIQNKGMEGMITSIRETISALNEKLNRIELKLAGAGIDDLKANIESLKESRVKTDMKVEALFRAVDLPKRASDL